MNPSTQARTLAQAVMDVRYGVQFGEMNERFWTHVDTLLNLLGAIGGSAAIAGALAQHEALAVASGLAIALGSVLQMVLQPGRRAIEFRDARREFAALDARAWSMPLPELDTDLKRLQAQSPVGFSALALPAFNANLRANGIQDGLQTLTLWQRLMTRLA